MSDARPQRVMIRLAGAPRGKGRPRFNRATGGAYTPEATRSYEAQLRYAAQQTMNGYPPFTCPIEVYMVVAFAVPTSWSRKKRGEALADVIRPTVKPDADNTLKLTDALNGVVFVDDKQVVDVTLRKVYRETPGLTIEVGATMTRQDALRGAAG